jgi:hypothetical protein
MSHGELPENLYRQGIPTAFAGRSPGYFLRLDADAANFFLLVIEDGQHLDLEAFEFEFFRFLHCHFYLRLLARDLNPSSPRTER